MASGHRVDAIRALENWKGLTPGQKGEYYAMLGEKDLAIEWLTKDGGAYVFRPPPLRPSLPQSAAADEFPVVIGCHFMVARTAPSTFRFSI